MRSRITEWASAALGEQGLGERLADRARRVQRTIGILKHHLDFAAEFGAGACARRA